MNNIWGDMSQYNPVVWHWVIAVYLFLAGLSAGSLLIGIGLRWFNRSNGMLLESPVLKAAAVSAPVIITLGLACLVFDLTKPLNFWVILVRYNFTSVMSLGVLALLIYSPLAYAYAALVFRDEVTSRFPSLTGIIHLVARLRTPLEFFLFCMSIVIAAYTGFLLSAMNSYPMLNTSVLPALFLCSALSAGAASNNLLALTFFGGDTSDEQSEQIHNMELPVITLEIMFLFLLFVSLYFSGGAALEAVYALSTGVWAKVFWVGVVAVGFGIPLGSLLLPGPLKHSRGLAILSACASLTGVLCLRHFIIYAGQNYIS